MGIDKKYLTEGIPNTAWLLNRQVAEKDKAFMHGPDASYVQIKALFEEQLDYYEMVRERLLHEIAIRKQSFYQARVRRVSLGNHPSGRRIKPETTPFDLPEEWTLKEAMSYKELLEQVDVLDQWCKALHDEFPNIEQYFTMKIAKARQFGMLIEDRPIPKYKFFTRSHAEKAQFKYYVPFPLLMRDLIGPVRNFNALHYQPGKPGYRLWHRLIKDMTENLIGRGLLPEKTTNVYKEEEDTFNQLFMDITLKWQNLTHSAPKSSAVRIDLVYAIVMTRSEEDASDFEDYFEHLLLGQMLDEETTEGIRGFCRRQWHEVFEPTDVMEYWNIR